MKLALPCPVPGCRNLRRIETHVMCWPCWRHVPFFLKAEVWKQWKHSAGSRDHLESVASAIKAARSQRFPEPAR